MLCLGLVAAGCAGTPMPSAPDMDDGPVRTQGLRVASFNILSTRSEGPRRENWESRKGAVERILRELDGDIVSLQEVETKDGNRFNAVNIQLSWLKEALPEYGFAAVGDPGRFPSLLPILYRRDRFDLIDQDFELHPGQDAAPHPRQPSGRRTTYTSRAVLRDRVSGHELHVFNVHFDHVSGSSRLRSARHVADSATALIDAGARVLLLGDFNAVSVAPTIAMIERTPLQRVPLAGPTFHFGTGIGIFPAIDHLFYGPGFVQAGEGLVLRRNYAGVVPSDHHPVAVDLVYDDDHHDAADATRSVVDRSCPACRNGN